MIINLKKEKMKILGIDPGTGRMGWAVISKELVVSSRLQQTTHNKQQTILVACGLIKTPVKTPLSERLGVIYKELEKIIKKYQPDQLAIEELFFVKNVKTAISVSHARGVAMLVSCQGGLDIFEYKPNEIKLAITGYGHANKAQIAKMLKLHLKGCSIKQDDTADAVAVALCHLQSRKSKFK